MITTVHTSECRTLPDGRRKHFFVKVDGRFACTHCGVVSEPGRRWERPRAAL